MTLLPFASIMTHMTNSLKTPHGELHFPVYLPDATFGVVRAVDAGGVEDCQVQAVVMNAFHLMQKPGSTTVQALGGLHNMSGWSRPILTDSGGFQAYSLIHQNPKFGKMTSDGIAFTPEGSERKFQLTPEKSIQFQLRAGADILVCLDDCTHVEASRADQELSVTRTIAWAKRCRKEFDQLCDQKELAGAQKPCLFGVVQGGGERDLRKQCAEALLEIGFDGFGFGGWPLDKDGNLLEEILGYTRALIPAQFPFHALGVGHPYNVAACYRLGYAIFDSAMPTRDARHGRMYAFKDEIPNLHGNDWLQYVYIEDERYVKADEPLSPGCDCPTCKRYSAGYLRHLYKIGDSLYHRLATQHNLRTMTRLETLLGAEAV